jgi:hypothetical protein
VRHLVQKYAGLAIQAPRSHVLPIDGVAMDLVVCLDRSKSMSSYWQLVIVRLDTLYPALCTCALRGCACAHAALDDDDAGNAQQGRH